MTQYNDAERQAGAMLFSNLKMFNESVVFFEKKIEPVFWKGFYECINIFIKKNKLAGVAEDHNDNGCWFAPHSWQQEANTWRYWFGWNVVGDDDHDYYLALITNTGQRPTRIGFSFRANADNFDGVKGFNNFVSRIDSRDRERLSDLNLEDKGKGHYFFPVILDAQRLAQCWEEHGKFPGDHDVFEPLNAVLEETLRAIDIINEIFPQR